ncbi:MAG: type I restriction-modification system subunit M N-terminal domain-containing protein [Alistipes sp.]|nr:type I restriction-modification system subunit M N-terminal domain-containing protein [Alistipes sp.]
MAANKYGQPILGLIFLHYADVLFKQHKAEIDDEYNSHKGTRMEREYKDIAVEKCGFFLPECAYFDYINDAPDDARKAVLAETVATGTAARRMTSTPTPRITPTTSTRTLRSSFNGLQHLNPSR